MQILAAIRNEKRRIAKRIASLQVQMNALDSAVAALNGHHTVRRSTVRHYVRHHKRAWSVEARRAQGTRMKAYWAKRHARRGLKVAA